MGAVFSFLESLPEFIWNFAWGVARFVFYIVLPIAILCGILYGLYKLLEWILSDPEDAADRLCFKLVGDFQDTTLDDVKAECDPTIVSQCQALMDTAYLIEDKCGGEFCDAFTVATNCFCRRCGCYDDCEKSQKEEVCPRICNESTQPPVAPASNSFFSTLNVAKRQNGSV